MYVMMYTYTCICDSIYPLVYQSVYLSIYLSIYLSVYMYVMMYTYTCICDSIYSLVHRIGRTGRCGKTGIATTFINKGCGMNLEFDGAFIPILINNFHSYPR